MQWNKPHTKIQNWHTWYAWYPTQFDDGTWVWLEYIERRRLDFSLFMLIQSRPIKIK